MVYAPPDPMLLQDFECWYKEANGRGLSRWLNGFMFVRRQFAESGMILRLSVCILISMTVLHNTPFAGYRSECSGNSLVQALSAVTTIGTSEIVTNVESVGWF